MLGFTEELQPAPPANDNVEIGYGKPPTEQQFKPGQSGNVKGRPKGAKNRRPAFGVEQLKSTILMEVYNEIEVQEGEETVTIPKATAIVRKMLDKAVGGDTRAAQIITAMVQSIERENRQRLEENLQIAGDYKRHWHKEEAYRESIGRKPLNARPHSKYVNVNLESGDIEITGPINDEEQVRWDIESSAPKADDGSDATKNTIPKKILLRSKNFPGGFWSAQRFLRTGELIRSEPIL